DVLVLAGAEPDRVLPSGFFSRLVRDVRSVDKPIVADLSGEAAKAVAAEGPTVLKMSHEELAEAGLTEGDAVGQLHEAGRGLVGQGVAAMLISRAGEPTLLVTAEASRLLVGPVVTPLDHRGAGDSMTAGVAVALGRGASVAEAARLGAAAGALNVTRRGLGTGRREQIERFAGRIGIEDVRSPATAHGSAGEVPDRTAEDAEENTTEAAKG